MFISKGTLSAINLGEFSKTFYFKRTTMFDLYWSNKIVSHNPFHLIKITTQLNADVQKNQQSIL